MKLKNLIKFRHIRVRRLTRIQLAIRLCALGAAVCLIMALASYTFIDKDYKSNVKSGELTVDFTEYISVRVLNTPLYIYSTDDELITVKYVCDSNVSVYDDHGRLMIEQEPEFVISLLAAQQLDYRVELYLPQKAYQSINLTTNNGKIYADALDSYMLSIKSKDGYVCVDDLKCSGNLTLDFETAGADIDISAFSGGRLTNVSGNINLSFDDPASIYIIPGSRCYFNGIAVSGEAREGEGDELYIASPSGRVRIFTGTKN